MRFYICALSMVLLAACATPPPTKQELAVAQTHLFRGVELATFNRALDVTFEASRPKAYVMRHVSPTRFVARHEWSQFAIVTVIADEETWEITATPNGQDIIAIAAWSFATGDFVPLVGATPPDELSNYALLWARLEYVLGKRPDWLTCDVYRRTMLDPRSGNNNIRSMCGYRAMEAEALPARVQ